MNFMNTNTEQLGSGPKVACGGSERIDQLRHVGDERRTTNRQGEEARF